MSDKGKKSVQNIKANTLKKFDKLLSDGSLAVMATGGFYIYQEGGTTHVLARKLVRVENKYFNLLIAYLRATNGEITLSAKQAFETGDIETIKRLSNPAVPTK